jgi:hypothetical protein
MGFEFKKASDNELDYEFKRVCPMGLIFCNKDMNSCLTSSLWFNVGMCYFVIVKAFPHSIAFLTPWFELSIWSKQFS